MIENPRLVIDVSHYDDHLDVPLLKKAGVAAVIVKCGSGMQRDPKFVGHAQAVVDGGLVLMAYYWDDIIYDPTAQAMWVMEDINSTGLPVKFIWADQEQWWTNWSSWLSARRNEIPYSAVPRALPANISQHNRIFAAALNAIYPQSGVYSNYGFITTWAAPIKEWLGLFPIWVAHYGRQPRPPVDCTWEALQKEWLPDYPLLVPPGAKEEWIVGHQFTGDAFRLPGVYDASGHTMLLDVSIFSEKFLSVISAGQVPPKPPVDPDPSAPPPGAPEYYVNVPILNVRNGPGTQFNIIGWLNKNTTVKVVEIQGNWAHLDGGAWTYAPYLTPVNPLPPVPPVNPPVPPVNPPDPPVNPPDPPVNPPDPPLDPPKERQEYYVNVPAVNVRSGPGTEYNIIGKLYQNTKVNTVEIQGQWAHLDDDTWVFAAYLSLVV